MVPSRPNQYVVTLSESSIDRRLVRVIKKYRNMFPLPGKEFEIKIGKLRIKAKLDRFYRFYLSKKVDEIFDIKIYNTLVINKDPNGTYSLYCKKE